MADNKGASSNNKDKANASDGGPIGEAIELVKTYVRQETVGPLKSLGRKIGRGALGALLLGMGVFFAALGLLRLIQSKLPRLATGMLSWLSYLIVFVLCAIATALAVWRISKIEKELN